MIKNEYNIIGVMSGTSLDGVDLVYVTFHFKEAWYFKIIHSQTVGYTDTWLDTLKNLVSQSIEELKTIDENYTLLLANIIKEFIAKHNIKDIDAVCSHGHTALHQPEQKFTYQIGNLPVLAKLLRLKVVCDFRDQDVKLGGQGAPLVPIGDQLLFPKYDFCLNLGGFANISTSINNDRIAYDICPVNIVLNHYVRQLGQDYDNKGQMASSGKLHTELLTQLNVLGFYNEKPPKSLGLEWVNAKVFPLIDGFHLDTSDVLNTVCEHIAIQISKAIDTIENVSVLVTGGGAYNDYLISRIKAHSRHSMVIPSKEIIEFKEALIFALLGVLKFRGEINCLKSVTGASQDHCSGNIFLP